MEAPDFYCSTRTATSDFVIEDLLDFSNEEDMAMDDPPFNNSTDSSSVTTVADPQFNAYHAFPTDTHFSGELCVPYDDLAELEWLSTFVEDSFSSDDLQKLQLISGGKPRADQGNPELELEFQHENNRNNSLFAPDVSVPGKARSKRSRAAPNNWSSRLLVLSPTTSSSDSDIIIPGKKVIKAKVKKEASENLAGNSDGRRCLHCATDKTPQWRTGPLGPKTLCNACGVRFKSGRLVPEYRPASSPTFVQAQHSNSHRKVMELRRQKEMHMSHQHQQYMHHNAMYNGSNADDYLIHRHGGPDYRRLI